MSHVHQITAAVCAVVSMGAIAQNPLGLLDPVDLHAAVPPIRYESALRRYLPAEDTASPDKVWRQANEEVQGGGHAGHGSQADTPKTAPVDSPDAHSMHHHGMNK